MSDLIKIDPNWPQWKKDEAEAVNAKKVAMAEAKARPPQTSGPQGPSDLQLSRQRREAEAKAAEVERAAAAASSSKGSETLGGKARDRAKSMDEFLERAQTGQSTDSNN